MKDRLWFVLGLSSLLALAASSLPAASAKALATYSNLPLSFEAGPDESTYVARVPGYRVSLTPGGAALTSGGASFGIRLSGANPAPKMEGIERLPGRSNHFAGSDPAHWRLNVPQYAKVRYREVYPGVDLVFYGRAQRLEYDFILAPGAAPETIRLEFEGAQTVRVDERGDLVVKIAGGEVRQHRPAVYQKVDGRRRSVAGGYTLAGGRQVAFRIGAYDRSRPLVIDPVLSYATFLGGRSTDIAVDAAVDASGNIYVVGGTTSPDFPSTPGVVQQAYGGGVLLSAEMGIGIGDGFVTKISPDGSSIVYSTFLGGSAGDIAAAVAVDASGNAYITGFTQSQNFPTTEGAVQTANRGGKVWAADFPLELGDAFVTKLDANGALVYSTYLGGTGNEGGMAIAVDASGNAYVAGTTSSADFPTSEGAIQRAYAGGGALAADNPIDFGDGFITKLNDTGTAIVYSTYLGGSKSDLLSGIVVDGSGAAYVGGTTWSKDFPVTPGAYRAAGGDSDIVVAKLNESGTALLYASSFGGRGADEGFGLAVDAGGNAYVAGRTRGLDFPVTPGAYQTKHAASDDAFLAKLNAAGTELAYATYLGGQGAEMCLRPAVDAAGNAYLAGDTRSRDFPTTADAIQRSLMGQHSVFVAKFDPSGAALVYSTMFNGRDDNKATRVIVDAAGNVYAVGFTSSRDFPVTSGAAQPTIGGLYDGFVLKISELGGPAPAALRSPAAEQARSRPKGIKLLRWLKSVIGAK